MASSTEALAGLVDRVTFHDAENGFCVLRVKARGQRDLITLVGHAAMISAGEFAQANGSWINDRTHGIQFRASFIEQEPYRLREVTGIGPKRAERIIAGWVDQKGARLRDDNPQEPGLGVPGCRHPIQYSALPNAAAELGLHGSDPRQTAGGAHRPEEGASDRR